MSEPGREFVDALSLIADFERKGRYFSYALSGKRLPLEHRLWQTDDYRGLGHLYETFGAAELAFLHFTDRSPFGPMYAWFALNMAAHSYHKAGETELAALVARRVLLDAEPVYQSRAILASGASHFHWYLVEMMGDAAAVLDPALAHRYYREALEGSATVDQFAEEGEASDYTIGPYLERMARYFLTGSELLYWELARHRIPAKISQWLKP